ncbi:hypothetical protein BDZ89DRAFT_337594 [Hymenopellis radicata]|nr:hypothetical protein BDZ89DRAFT_337594 [Hymenopellis radicata]
MPLQICSHLRTTVHANPKLWSVIQINVYKRGLWGGWAPPTTPPTSHAPKRKKSPTSFACPGRIRLPYLRRIRLMSTCTSWPAAFELAEQSPALPLMRCALGRCRQFKIAAFAGQKFNDVISDLLRGMALPMLRDASFYESAGWWDGSHALELLLTGAPVSDGYTFPHTSSISLLPTLNGHTPLASSALATVGPGRPAIVSRNDFPTSRISPSLQERRLIADAKIVLGSTMC